MIGAAGFVFAFLLIFAGVPLGFAMALAGFVGFGAIVGLEPAFHMMGQVVHSSSMTYAFSVLPLFILMGNFVARSRLSADLFDAAERFVGHRPGGLARATVWTCGGFAAICGSSAATCVTMTKVALPAMRSRGYDDRLSLGVIAAGGSLGILIPPSGVMLIYGVATETSVPALFAAGILPGLLAIILLSATVKLWTMINPEIGPAAPRVTWRQRVASLKSTWGVILLFSVVMGGIVGGVFTAAEGGGIGAFGAFLFALSRRAISWDSLFEILIETGITTAVLFTVVFGAFVFANFVEVTGVPVRIGTFVEQLALPPSLVMLAIILIYIVLGIVLEEISMMLLTIPLFFPIVTHLGYDPVWFGILLIVVVELGMITPPIGLNLFVIQTQVPGVTMQTLLAATTPFALALVVLLLALLAFPGLALTLPRLLGL